MKRRKCIYIATKDHLRIQWCTGEINQLYTSQLTHGAREYLLMRGLKLVLSEAHQRVYDMHEVVRLTEERIATLTNTETL